MKFNFVHYCQYLLKSHTDFTMTNLENHLKYISHNIINCYYKLLFENGVFNSENLWRNVEE